MPIPFLTIAASTVAHGVMGLFNRKAHKKSQEQAQLANLSFQNQMEDKRRELQLLQMQMSYLQQEKNQHLQRELAESAHQKAVQLEGLRQSFQTWLAQDNYDRAGALQQQGHEKAVELEKLRQSFQTWLAEFNSDRAASLQQQGHEKALELESIRQSFQTWLTEVNYKNARELQELGHQKVLELENIRQSFQTWLAEFNSQKAKELQQLGHENALELEKFRQTVSIALNDKNLNFQKWRFEQEKKIQREIIELQQEFQREIAYQQHQYALEQIRERIRSDKSPIVNLASDLLKPPFLNGVMPLQILLSPPQLDYDAYNAQNSGFKSESFLAEEIRKFLKNRYHINSAERPTILVDRAWTSKKYGGGAAIHSLYAQLQTIPVLILESEIAGEYLNFRYTYWSGDQMQRLEDTILSRFPYKRWLYESAKKRAAAWLERRAELRQRGMDETEIKRLGGVDEENAIILTKEQEYKQNHGMTDAEIEKTTIARAYKLALEDYEAFYQHFSALHCIVIGLMADSLFLQRSFQTKPLLPNLLPSLLENLSDPLENYQETVSEIVKTYQHLYHSLESDFSRWIPEVMMDFALSLADLPDSTFALEQANQSVAHWLKLNGVEQQKVFNLDSDQDCQLLKSLIYQEDEPYFASLQKLIDKLETKDPSCCNWVQGKSLLAGWRHLHRWGDIPKLPEIKLQDVKTFEPVLIQSAATADSIAKPLASASVAIADVQVNSNPANTSQAQSFTQDLDGQIALEMVAIPAGSCLMGTSETEAERLCAKFRVDYFQRETPQHAIALPAFYLSKYPIVQAQWRAIAQRQDFKVSLDLHPHPSNFTGDNLPVEQITWLEAVEFCQRLAKLTGKNYQLPSEAQWEYACRAGTTTAFNLGETLTEELANYDSGRSQRQTTTPVGQFPANAFGLYDLHGQVWEWCEDDWHENYQGAPDDGKAWLGDVGQPAKVLRGGSWSNHQSLCRSAYRSSLDPSLKSSHIGFRVAVIN